MSTDIDITRILEIASQAYDGGEVRLEEDLERGERGDTLADFVAIELRECVDETTGEEAITEAIRCMGNAVDQLQSVLTALEAHRYAE